MRVAGTISLDGSSLSFAQGGNSTTLTAGSPAGDITLTLPIITDTIVGVASSANLLNKTLTSPTLITPALGAATATTLNGLTITATTGTLTMASGSTLVTSGANSITLTSTGATNVTLPTSGTLATSTGTLAQFAATSSAALAGVISDETGSGALVFGTSPTITGGTITALPEFSVLDASTVHTMRIRHTSGGAMTSNRVFSVDLNDANRRLELAGDLFVAGNQFVSLTSTGTGSDITFPEGTFTAATLTGVEVLTSKDYDGGAASNTSRVTLPKAATATLNALTRKEGTLVYDTTTGQVKFDTGATLTALGAASLALTDAHIFVGNGSNIATDVAVTGDVTISNAGVTAIGSGVIVDADINGSAAIAGSKLVAAASGVAGAVSTGTQTLTGIKTFETQAIIKGTATDDSAASGYVGEHIVSTVGATAFTTSVYADLTTITLPAGDYDVTGWALLAKNGDTFTSVNFEIGLSNAVGNSNDRLTPGDTYQYGNSAVPTTFTATSMHIGPIRVTSDGTNLKVGNQAESAGTGGTALGLKIYVGERSVGTAGRVYGTLRARRVR